MNPAVGLLLLAFGTVPDPCLRPGWQEGDPIVGNDAAACLSVATTREQVEADARAGDIAAIGLLVDYYLVGAGDDEALGEQWLRAAVRTGDREAAFTLGLMLVRGAPPRTAAEQREGEALLTPLAAGNTEAATRLADHLQRTGRVDAAMQWYERAARGGDVTAMRSLALGHMARGDCTSRRQAALWYRVAGRLSIPGTYAHRELAAAGASAFDAARCSASDTAAFERDADALFRAVQRSDL